MAKQTINIGTTANDGTGDPIRAAFGKVNDNFTEIYTANTGVNTGDQNLSAYATTAAVAAGYQPLDSDLTAISALTTTAYGRALLSTADAATLRSAIGVGQTDAPTFLAQTLTSQGLANAPSLAIGTGAGFYQPTNTQISFSGNNTEAIRFTGGGIRLGTNDLGWGTFAINNLILTRDADGILAQRNGTNAQAFRVANSVGASPLADYDRGVFDFKTTTNTLRIGTENGGTYTTARPIDFVVGGVVRMSIGSAIASMPGSFNAAGYTVTGSSIAALGHSGIAISIGSNVWNTQHDGLMLAFRGTTAAFPGLKRSTVALQTTYLQARLADDSAFTNIQGKLTTDTAYTATVVTPTGFLTLYDSTGQAYRVPCVV